jgi:VWFA-related protein
MARACLSALFLPVLLAAPLAAPDQPRARVVHVTALGRQDVPVEDLTTPDFTVKEDGQTRQIVSVEPATAAMQIAIIIDDNGTGIFRYGLGDFVQRLQGRAEIALSAVQGQTMKIVDFTMDVPALANGISRLGVRPGSPDGGQLLEGISEAARELRQREARRPVIVALTVGGEEHSTLTAKHVLDQLHQSGAALYVIFAGNQAVRPTSAVSKPSDLLDGNLNIGEVLGDGPKQSGGRRRDVIATTYLFGELQQIARELKNQYAITYVRPDNARPPQKINVSVSRKGVTVIAPSRAPVR